MAREIEIPKVSDLSQSYNGNITLEINPEVMLSFPREKREALLHNEVERILLMLDWEENRREVADYVQGKENKERD